MEGNPDSEKAEVFATNVLTEPDVEAVKKSRVPLSKRKVPNGEGPKRKPKKSKTSQITAGVEGVEGAPINDPRVKDSQTLEGFRSRTMKSVVAKRHLRHFRDHYSINPKVQMRVPLEGEPVDFPLEEGYTPVFWELFNYGLRLRASPFVNSLLSVIGRTPGYFTFFVLEEKFFGGLTNFSEKGRFRSSDFDMNLLNAAKQPASP
ncbi:hypothetical protein LIER_41316 [Lithospermum erythrorhizon]|uniref:Uncharacterized protein n=1 Tax=Lithospermum erythrorhizon TaxID=34254 RepID=A0AAV3R7E5_LITER